MKKILEATLLKNEDGTYQYSECNSNGFNKISDAIGASGLEEVFATVHNLPEGAVILGEDGKAFCIMWEETEMKEEREVTSDLTEKLIENGWREGNNCYYTEESDGIYYYNTEARTLSFAQDNNSPEEFVAKVETYEEITRYVEAI
jgi:hypothetical protein